MKNEYVRPDVMECLLVADGVMASSQNGMLDIRIGDDVECGTTDAGRGRGEWGNLWKSVEIRTHLLDL